MLTQSLSQLNPPLKWAGGKRWLIPRLSDFWHTYQDYTLVEPFVGGLAIALGLQPQQALLNDINQHVINFYHWLQRGLVIDFELRNDQTSYYRYRDQFNQLIRAGAEQTAQAAGLFYYLNRTGYNGLCRFNQRGLFNVPFGRYKRIRYCYDFSHYAETLGQWQFQQGHFIEMQIPAQALIYADPPYDVPFRAYSQQGFSWAEQVQLAEWLAQHPGPVLASNQATQRILDLYRHLGFAIEILPAPRRIACNGDRQPALEMLAFKGA
ncbi:MAG: Dam family site-specific DNA-(adenine-N6)-methyltransferase [Chloroflexi bacterium]|nr:Dam family site-specific DNA-(adenine-N6)-methyltransferase [Chloroflexota bacterium]